MPVDVFSALNAVGLLAFAAVGALKAIDSELDLLGIVVLGVTTALGGGVVRDLLIDAVPTALRSTADVSVALAGVCLALAAARALDGLATHPAVLVPDAVGLGAFAATGALVGAGAAVSPFGVVLLATVTGVGGGALADLLRGEVPFVLREDFYATCAVVGGAGFVAVTAAGVDPRPAAFACAATVTGLRLAAIRFAWELPTAGAARTP